MSQAATDAQRRAAGNIRRFYTFRFITHFQLWMPIWILYLHDSRGLSLTEILLLDALFEIMMLLAEVPTGVVADRWGRRRSMLLGQVGVTLAVIMFAFAPTFEAVLACYAVWAVSGALTSGSDIAFVHDSLETAGQGGEFRNVIARGNAAQIAGMAVSSMIGAPIAALTSLPFTVALSIGCAVLAIPVVWSFHDTGALRGSPEVRYFALLGTAARRVVHTPRLRTLFAMQGVFSGIVWGAMILTQSFFDERGLPLAWFGVALAGLHFVAFGAALYSSRLANRFGSQPVLFVAPTVIAASLLVLSVAPLWGGIMMFAVIRVALNVLMPVVSDAINRESLDEVRATIASMGTMCISVVGASAKPFLGWTADANGLGSVYVVAGLALAGGGTLVLLVWAKVSRGPQQVIEPEPTPAVPPSDELALAPPTRP